MRVDQEGKEQKRVMNLIVLVDRSGFPNGNASANRLALLGQALVEQGVFVKIVITKWSDYQDNIINIKTGGNYKGIDFEYTYGNTVRDSSFIVRRLRAFRGWLLAAWRILTAPERTVLYLYSDSPGLCIPATIIAKLRKIPVVIELCEWRPSVPSCRKSVKWYYKNLRFTLANGVFVISSLLEQRVKSIVKDSSKPKILTIPILTDINETCNSLNRNSNGRKYVLWCGQLDGYINSILWLIQVFSCISQNDDCYFYIVGRYRPELQDTISSFIKNLGINEERIVLTGYVTRQHLLELYRNAQALLAPLEDDERSNARFPTKIGEYLASGKPVITNSVSDINHFLKDGETAFISPPGDVDAFARNIKLVLSDNELSVKVGKAGKQIAQKHFYYSKHGKRIAEFLNELF